jgi:hypothetical protein
LCHLLVFFGVVDLVNTNPYIFIFHLVAHLPVFLLALKIIK